MKHTTAFARYGNMKHLELRQLIRVPDIWARAENSGSEGCYVEVARWSHLRKRWEKFCFEKFFGSELWEGLNASKTCQKLAHLINRKAHNGEVWPPIVHSMPTFNPKAGF